MPLTHYRGIYGAARAAEESGNLKAARVYYEKLESLTAARDTELPELVHAREFLKKK